ncbi:helix-turn-helix domain-containing protein [Pirellulaceae bacterium SH449]
MEQQISGDKIGLSFIRRVAAIRSHSASRISWHSHDCYEIILLADGATSYEFKGGTRVELSGGCFLVTPPHLEHRGSNDVRSPGKLLGIMFDPGVAPETHSNLFMHTEFLAISNAIQAGTIQTRRMGSALRSMVRDIPTDMEQVQHGTYLAEATLRGRLCQLFVEIAKQLKINCPSEPRFLVDAAVLYMKSKLFEESTVDEVANHVHCCRAKLFEVFKECVGMSPNDYWQRIRIEATQDMLRNTELSVTEVAIRCGYSTSQYFSTVFRKYTGTTPSQFRRKKIGKPMN